jgi:hypothetical protein
MTLLRRVHPTYTSRVARLPELAPDIVLLKEGQDPELAPDIWAILYVEDGGAVSDVYVLEPQTAEALATQLAGTLDDEGRSRVIASLTGGIHLPTGLPGLPGLPRMGR